VLRKNATKRKSTCIKPNESYVLINVDASFKLESLEGGIGAIIHDVGNFIAACNDPINYAIDVNTLEVSAVSRGLALANQLRCSRIIVQSDCLQVVETLQSGCFSSTAAAALFEDIFVQASTLSKCEFSFCNREANAVAD
jgi:ribonuclease HI